MSPYPPGLSRRDKIRGGIIQEPIHCVECDTDVTSEDHEDWCELSELDVDELAELAAEEQIATEYDPIEHK